MSSAAEFLNNMRTQYGDKAVNDVFHGTTWTKYNKQAFKEAEGSTISQESKKILEFYFSEQKRLLDSRSTAASLKEKGMTASSSTTATTRTTKNVYETNKK